MPVSLLVRTLPYPRRDAEIAHQLLAVGKSPDISHPATDCYGGRRPDARNRHQPLGLRIFLPRFPYLFVQVLNLAVDDFEKFHVLADNTRSVPAKLLCPPGHRPQPMPNHAGSLNIPLSVERVQLVDHGGPVPSPPPPMGQERNHAPFSL